MKNLLSLTFITVILVTDCLHVSAKQWTLQECIDYAMQNNIQLQKSRIQQQSSSEGVKGARAALLPSLSASTNQQFGYTPFMESQVFVSGSQVYNGSKKTSYSGNYGLNANWTAWNGNKNYNTLKQQKIAEQQAELQTQVTANSIQEQLAQYYVQILYSKEAVVVNKEMLNMSKQNLERGQEMYKVGSIAKAELAQLESQVASDEYDLVSSEGQLATYKLQLKQLLELDGMEEFDIIDPASAEAQALAVIPSVNDVYTTALMQRPEIKNSNLSIESSELDIKLAKAGILPNISLSASVGANTSSRSQDNWGEQMKTGLNGSVGVNVSIPIFDNRSTRTAVNKAKLSKESQQLELDNQKKELWRSIETYWVDATTNQARFKSATSSVASAKTSYELLSEQYKVGLKNITDLLNGKNTLLQSEQNRLQSKYMTILDIQLLKFYMGENVAF